MTADDGPRAWTDDDVPPGPYLHGSRREYEVGDCLSTSVVSNMDGEEDPRQRCFATTDCETALRWAYQRGLSRGGEMLYVYEVDMQDPEVDINYHRPGSDERITSVMSHCGVVTGLHCTIALADYPDRTFG